MEEPEEGEEEEEEEEEEEGVLRMERVGEVSERDE
jgi:hypothetical protein